mmetsp:Transcript_5153/g.22205  ORF Transcript_5153/g.22205 Transcript_5153/m.22205 type:complete len:83 (+) Transcript_5153:1349-1597(+)
MSYGALTVPNSTRAGADSKGNPVSRTTVLVHSFISVLVTRIVKRMIKTAIPRSGRSRGTNVAAMGPGGEPMGEGRLSLSFER